MAAHRPVTGDLGAARRLPAPPAVGDFADQLAADGVGGSRGVFHHLHEGAGAVLVLALVVLVVAADRFDDAAEEYFRLTPERSRRALSPVHSIALSNWLANHGHPDASLIVYQRHLRDYPMGPYAAEAHLGAGLVQLHARTQPTAAYQHLVAVFDLDPHPETERHARNALADIARRQKFQVGGVH